VTGRDHPRNGLAGQVAIVTGAAQGLGLSIARRLASEGMVVCLADIEPSVVETASSLGENAWGVVCDVSDAEAVNHLVEGTVISRRRLDLFVANAGVGGGGPIAEMTDDAYRRIISINLDGAFYSCRAAARAMISQGSGVILTVSSIFGRDMPIGSGVYGASKAGVIALTQALAREVGPLRIRVNCISPGNMATEMHWRALQSAAASRGRSFEELRESVRTSIPLQRHGTGDDIAGLVVFLASPDASYITGQTINVDGGYQPR
jgi:NAD(P)-dependent dehydrogenase (short-subunit alcohol dehydrogenase family)